MFGVVGFFGVFFGFWGGFLGGVNSSGFIYKFVSLGIFFFLGGGGVNSSGFIYKFVSLGLIRTFFVCLIRTCTRRFKFFLWFYVVFLVFCFALFGVF